MSRQDAPRSTVRVGILGVLAARSLLESRLVSILLVLAVAAATGFQIPNTANLDGFTAALLEEGLRAGSGDVQVTPRDRALFADGAAEAGRVAAAAGGDVRAVIPILAVPGAIERAGRIDGALVVGLEPATPLLPFHVRSGASLRADDPRGLLLGTSLAASLGAEVGDEVTLRALFASGADRDDARDAVKHRMIVRGVVGGSAGAYRSVFVDRAFLADSAGAPDAASTVIVHLGDHYDAPRAAAAVSRVLPRANAVAWMDADPYLPNYIRANRIVSRVSYAMVIAAVAIPVWALLYIHGLRRRREIAILAALGFRRAEVVAVFLLQVAVVALVGCALGCALGYGLIRYFLAYPIFEWEGLVVRPLVTFGNFAAPCAMIFATTVVAGLFPAWRAARADPAGVLRRIE